MARVVRVDHIGEEHLSKDLTEVTDVICMTRNRNSAPGRGTAHCRGPHVGPCLVGTSNNESHVPEQRK